MVDLRVGRVEGGGEGEVLLARGLGIVGEARSIKKNRVSPKLNTNVIRSSASCAVLTTGL